MRALFNQVHKYVRDERGATAIEYTLILALMALAIIAAVTSVGASTSSAFEDVDAGWGG